MKTTSQPTDPGYLMVRPFNGNAEETIYLMVRPFNGNAEETIYLILIQN